MVVSEVKAVPSCVSAAKSCGLGQILPALPAGSLISGNSEEIPPLVLVAGIPMNVLMLIALARVIGKERNVFWQIILGVGIAASGFAALANTALLVAPAITRS